MTDIALRLKDEVLRLTYEDRLELARALWDSIEGPDEDIVENDAEWIEELNRRTDDLNAGRATAEPAAQVLAELREVALRERRSQ